MSGKKVATYDASQFNAPEYDARYEAKTKFYQIQVQGNMLASLYAKIGAAPASTVKQFESHEAAVQECAKLIKTKTGAKGKDKYEFKSEQGSKKVADLPVPVTKKSARAKKGKAEATEEGEEEEASEGAEAGQKRARGKDDAEMKTEETTAESDVKKAKIAETDTAGTKAPSSNDIAGKEKEKSFAAVTAKAADESKAMDTSGTDSEKKTEEKVASPPKAKAAIV